MPRASSILCLPAVLALAGAAHALELPVIVNGTQVEQTPKAPQPAGKMQLPVITNYPSAAFPAGDQKADGKPPVIAGNPAANRAAVAYVVSNVEYMAPVAYNAYGVNSTLGFDGGLSYGVTSPYAGALGTYSGYGNAYGGFAYPAYDTFGPWGYGAYPPLVEVLDTGVRANAGRLASFPSVRAPLYGHVMGVYYR